MATNRRGFLTAVAGLPAAFWLHDNKRLLADGPMLIVDEKTEREESSVSSETWEETSSTSFSSLSIASGGG